MNVKKIENFDKNVELLDYFISTKHVKDILTKVYGEIDDEIVDVVFYSIFDNCGTLANFYNETKTKQFPDLIKNFSTFNIIPLYTNRLNNEYIGYHVLDKRFVRIMFKKPQQEDVSTVSLFEKQAYIIREKSSIFDYYCNLHLIKKEYEALIEKAKSFMKIDSKIKNFLYNTEYKENLPKRKFLSKFFARAKEIKLIYRVVNFLKMSREKTIYNEECESNVVLNIFTFFDALLRLD